jgi:hypothetical protein
MTPQTRRSTPSLDSARSDEPGFDRTGPRLRAAPSRDDGRLQAEHDDPVSIPRRPLRAALAAANAWSDKRSETQPTLYAEERVAMASVIAEESIVSRESGALKMTAFAAMGLAAAYGALTLLRVAGTWLFG